MTLRLSLTERLRGTPYSVDLTTARPWTLAESSSLTSDIAGCDMSLPRKDLSVHTGMTVTASAQINKARDDSRTSAVLVAPI